MSSPITFQPSASFGRYEAYASTASAIGHLIAAIWCACMQNHQLQESRDSSLNERNITPQQHLGRALLLFIPVLGTLITLAYDRYADEQALRTLWNESNDSDLLAKEIQRQISIRPAKTYEILEELLETFDLRGEQFLSIENQQEWMNTPAMQAMIQTIDTWFNYEFLHRFFLVSPMRPLPKQFPYMLLCYLEKNPDSWDRLKNLPCLNKTNSFMLYAVIADAMKSHDGVTTKSGRTVANILFIKFVSSQAQNKIRTAKGNIHQTAIMPISRKEGAPNGVDIPGVKQYLEPLYFQ